MSQRQLLPNQSDSTKLDVVMTCPICHVDHTVTVNNKDFVDWRAGKHTQDAFPYLPADQREILITGIDGPCWTRMFSLND